MARRALADQVIYVRLFTRPGGRHGHYDFVKGSTFSFHQMSTADVWDLIATAARRHLFRVPWEKKRRVKP